MARPRAKHRPGRVSDKTPRHAGTVYRSTSRCAQNLQTDSFKNEDDNSISRAQSWEARDEMQYADVAGGAPILPGELAKV